MSKKREMIIKRGDTAFDRILAHHKNPEAFELTNSEQVQLERWRKIFTHTLAHYSRLEIVNMLVKDGLSQSQAYADIRNSESLFGSVMQANRDFERALFIAGAKDMIKRSIQKGDRKAEGKARDLWGKYGDLDKTDDAKFNPAKLENPEIRFDLDKQEMAALKQHTNTGKGGVDDLNLTGPIEYTDYEEIDDDAES